jgi:hypothetical protein
MYVKTDYVYNMWERNKSIRDGVGVACVSSTVVALLLDRLAKTSERYSRRGTCRGGQRCISLLLIINT